MHWLQGQCANIFESTHEQHDLPIFINDFPQWTVFLIVSHFGYM